MKKIYQFTFVFLFFSTTSLMAQYTGKKFISGSAGILMNNTNPSSSKATTDFGYAFNINYGKFISETKVTGWSIGNRLFGNKSF